MKNATCDGAEAFEREQRDEREVIDLGLFVTFAELLALHAMDAVAVVSSSQTL